MERLRKVLVDEVRVGRLAAAAVGPVSGVLIGRVGTGKAELVLTAIPAPPVEDGVAAESWAVEHAAAVERMLPGGLDIVGVFRFQREAVVGKHAVMLARTARAVMSQLMTKPAGTPHQSEAIVLMTGTDGRLQAKACQITSSSLDLRPTEIRIQANLNSTTAARTVRSKVRIDRASCHGLLPLVDDFEHVLDHAMATYNGCPVVPATSKRLVSQVLPAGKQSQDTVQIFMPSTEKGHLDNSVTRRSISQCLGPIDTIALVDGSSTIAFAKRSILQDISRSLRARVELLVEFVDEAQGCVPGVGRSFEPGFAASLPVRIYAQTEDNLWFTDYMQESESLEDVKDRMVDLLGLKAVEMESVVLSQPEQFGAAPVPKQSASTSAKREAAVAPTSNYRKFVVPIMSAVLIGLIAILIGIISRTRLKP